MKNILFTGVSSFTGFHFVRKLSENKKFQIFCTLSKNKKKYSQLQKERINIISKKKNILLFYNYKFGSKKFLELLKKKKFKVLCFHHSYTKKYYDNLNFNFTKSLFNNLSNVEKVFDYISKNSKLIISNSYFQPSQSERGIFSKYGISKNITYEVYKSFCKFKNIRYKSIFINNPWGILENKKFNHYLITNWLKKKEVIIKYPSNIRDNININLLSREYNKIVLSNSSKKEYYPTGYCSSNKVFVESLRQEFEKFFNLKTKVKYLNKVKSIEPLTRVNGSKILKKISFKSNDNLSQYFLYYKNI